MRHTVKMHGVIVGHSDLESADESLGRAWGAFRPGLGYELVQPVFRLFTQAVPTRGGEPLDDFTLARYHAARAKLALDLVDANGNQIETTTIHIADYLDEDGSLELDVLIRDAEYWNARQD